MSSWLKAGLIGGAVVALLSIVLTFVGQTLGLECAIWLVTLLVFAGIGALAAYWLPPLRQAGPAAGQGALAAVLAQLIGGLVLTVLTVVRSSFIDTGAVLSQLDPAMLDSLAEAGVDMQAMEAMIGPVGAIFSGGLCCVGGLIFAAILGAIGGALVAAIKPD
jgi:hypothetical protein